MTIAAKIIADSRSPAGIRLTTMQLRYPKFIHGEFMTHRVFSRNASSSRAIPVERMIQDVVDDPVYPSFWGKNQPGMQAREECDARVRCPTHDGLPGERSRREAWDLARRQAADAALQFHRAGYHKQVVNCLIEPFCHINVVVTATEWSNFFALRCHPDAQPEMRLLAEAMRDAIASSTPNRVEEGQWHAPYADQLSVSLLGWEGAIKLSVARCARVSYLTQDGKPPSLEEDLRLYDRLVGSVPLHASPTEHQATPDRRALLGFHQEGDWERPDLHGNLVGWRQYRKTLPGERQ